MPGVSYLGAKCTGHRAFIPRPNDQASGDVFVNNIAVHRQSDHWPKHTDYSSEHESFLQAGSSTVFVNNLQVSRIGDPVACGSLIAQGSSDVISG